MKVQTFERPIMRRQRGMTMIELMVAMLLGLLVVGGAVSIFASNKDTYRATDNLARVQENSRLAFELLARDLREVGANPCDSSVLTKTVLNDPSAEWWSNFDGSNRGLVGYEGDIEAPGAAFGTDPEARVEGTDAVELLGASREAYSVVTHDDDVSELHDSSHPFRSGDLVMICNTDQLTVGRLTAASDGSTTLKHVPGQDDVTWDNKAGESWDYGADPNDAAVERRLCNDLLPDTPDGLCDNTLITRLLAVRWYVGNATGGGRSLYRSALETDEDSGDLAVVTREVASDVTDLQINYLVNGGSAYEPSSDLTATEWPNVVAAQITLAVATPENVGLDGQPITRTVRHVVALRNRLK